MYLILVMVKNKIKSVLTKYQEAFSKKEINSEEGYTDILMDVFKITPAIKDTNMQYWGRELGMCWEGIIKAVFSERKDYGPGLKEGDDEICDCTIGKKAIEAKYRVGSGDSGTLKKFKQYAQRLKDAGFEPIMLFLREDNLPAAITASKNGGWTVIVGQNCFDFINAESAFDLKQELESLKGVYDIKKKKQTILS